MIRMLRFSVLLLLCLAIVGSAQNSANIFLKIDPAGDSNNPVKIQPGKTYQFTVKAYQTTDPTLPPVEVPITSASWSLQPATLGTISQTGELTVSSMLPGSLKMWGSVDVIAAVGQLTLTASSVILLDDTPPQYDYRINGVVSDESGNAIPNATVVALPYNGPATVSFSATTDQYGKYSVKVPAGQYLVTAQAQQFVLEYFDNVYSPDKATPVEVSAAKPSVTGINFMLGTGGRISGTVTDKSSGAPLQGALVYVWPVSSNPNTNGPKAKAVTDANGMYLIENLMPGNYLVFVSMQGYTSLYYDDVMDLKRATPVPVVNGQTTDRINFALDKGSIDPNVNPYKISGIVTDALNNPIADANLIAEMPPQPNGGVRSFAAKSGADGRYTVEVPGGIFTVRAIAQGYLPVYFDNVKTLGEATRLAMSSTNPSVDTVNFRLTAGGRISGRVIRAIDSLPVADAQVLVLTDPSKPPANSSKQGTLTDAQGAYTVSGLAPDAYLVLVKKQGYDDQFYYLQSDATLATRVVVNDTTNGTNIDFALDLTAGISGTVIDQDNNAPIANAVISIPTGAAARPLTATTDQNGDYSIPLLPGVYTQISAAAPMYATEWYNEKSSAQSADTVTVTKGVMLTGINFTLERFSGIIAGTVRDAAGNPLPKMTVTAWLPSSSNTPVPDPNAPTNTATSGADGTYEIRGLAPGGYTVSASGPGYLIQFYDNSPDAAGATPVQVVNKQTTSGIDFSLGRGGNIEGTVTDAKSGLPIPYTLVVARNSTTMLEVAARTDASGMYVVGGMPSGDYLVFAVAKAYKIQYYNNAIDVSSATLVTVTAPNTTRGIDFSLQPAPIVKSALTGSVLDAITQTPTSLPIIESLDPASNSVAITTTDENGGFELENNAQAIVRARAVGYVGAYAGGSANWNAGRVADPSAPLLFSLAPANAAGVSVLRGTVVDQQNKQPVANAWVYATDAAGHTFFACANEKGQFAFRGISGGPVTVALSSVQYEQTKQTANVEHFFGSMVISAKRTGMSVSTPPAARPLPVFELKQNYPNPFNPSTTIAYGIPASGKVTLRVYNLLGEPVATLVSAVKAAGNYTAVWNADEVPSGIYIYRLEANGSVMTRKMTLLK